MYVCVLYLCGSGELYWRDFVNIVLSHRTVVSNRWPVGFTRIRSMDSYLLTGQFITLLPHAHWHQNITHIGRKSGKSLETFQILGSTGQKSFFRLVFSLVFKRKHLLYYFGRQEVKSIPEHENVTSTERGVRNGIPKCVLSVLALCRLALGGC